jgi:hypothetical protein
MKRMRLARQIWKLWKRRNYYKYWYHYEKEANNAWNNHYEQRQFEWEEEKRKRDKKE